jgi:hypothetical protein
MTVPAAPGPSPRLARAALVLVHATVAFAVLTTAADLAVTIAFRDHLLAAERAIADRVRPEMPVGASYFTTDTVGFARGWAIAALAGMLLVLFVAIRLARATSGGSERARLGLTVLMGVMVALALCLGLAPSSNLAAEPAAGALLNGWSVIRIVAGVLLAALAGAAFVPLFITTRTLAAPPRS